LNGFPNLLVQFAKEQRPLKWEPRSYMYRKVKSFSDFLSRRRTDKSQKEYLEEWCPAFENDGPHASTTLGLSWMTYKEISFDLLAREVRIAEAHCPEHSHRPESNTRGYPAPAPSVLMTTTAPPVTNAPDSPGPPYYQNHHEARADFNDKMYKAMRVWSKAFADKAALQNLTHTIKDKLLHGIDDFIPQKPRRFKPETKALVPTMVPTELPSSTAGGMMQGVGRIEPMPENLLPWILVAVSLSCACICSGVAIGVICSARLHASDARELRTMLLECESGVSNDRCRQDWELQEVSEDAQAVVRAGETW